MSTQKYIRLPHQECPNCKGHGKSPEALHLDCDWCDGLGKVTKLIKQ